MENEVQKNSLFSKPMLPFVLILIGGSISLLGTMLIIRQKLKAS